MPPNQISPINIHSRERTYLYVRVRYNRKVPFGQPNRPTRFSVPELSDFCIEAYLYHIFNSFKTFEEHLTDLERVLNRLGMHELCVNREKCLRTI